MRYANTPRIDTTDYTLTHGRAPKRKGAWPFYMGSRDDISTLFCAPGCRSYAEARRIALEEARKQGVDYVSVGA